MQFCTKNTKASIKQLLIVTAIAYEPNKIQKENTMSDQNTRSISELQQQANNGDVQAQFDLALCYANGGEIEQDANLALEWATKSAEQGLMEAQVSLGLFYFLNQDRAVILNNILAFWHKDELDLRSFQFVWQTKRGLKWMNSDDNLAFIWLKKAASQSNTEAQYWLAYCYSEGIGVDQNDHLAFEWFKKSAEQEVAESKYLLAQYYLEGKGTEQNTELAFKWLTHVAEQTEKGHISSTHNRYKAVPEALILLGDLYKEGKYVEQNHALAFEWYQKASAYNTNGKAEYCLAECYEYGTGIEKNMTLAEELYRSAFDCGFINANALYRFAKRYLEGVNAERNYNLGMKYMMDASVHGIKEANDWLTNAYISLAIPSFLTDKDDGEQYYKLAANWCFKELNGHNQTEAYLLLSILYHTGKGIEQSDEQSMKYINKAMYISDHEYPGDINENENIDALINIYSVIFCGKKNLPSEWSQQFGYIFIEGIVAMPFYKLQNNKIFLTLLRIYILKKAGEYELAKEFTQEVFDKTDGMDKNFKEICLTSIEQEQQIAQQNQELEEKNKLLQASQIELEDMMSMFAHKFRSPLDAIIYNTQHDNQIALYTEAAQTMRGLLNIFSIISTDADLLKDKIKQDYQGSGNLEAVFSKTIDMILLHLLSVSGAEKIQQHYLYYAKSHGHCDTQISYKTWCEEYFELEQAMQIEWETSYAQLLKQSPTLEQRLTWLEKHFFKLEIVGFDRTDIQFKEYGTTESFLTILLNEILVNVFKYYSSTNNQHVTLEWSDKNAYQALICHNPSIRSERTIIKGSHKGHVFLSTLARKTNSLFEKPIPQDNFILEFGIPNELLISK